MEGLYAFYYKINPLSKTKAKKKKEKKTVGVDMTFLIEVGFYWILKSQIANS